MTQGTGKGKWVVGIAAALVVMLGAVVALHSAGFADLVPADHQVFVYEHTNYGGNYMSFEFDTLVPDLTKWRVLNSKDNWNDRISSIKVGKNTKIILFEHTNYKGATITLLGTGSGGAGNFAAMPSGWNDKASSFKVVMGDVQ